MSKPSTARVAKYRQAGDRVRFDTYLNRRNAADLARAAVMGDATKTELLNDILEQYFVRMGYRK